MHRKSKSKVALFATAVVAMIAAVLLGGGQTTAQAGPPEDAVLDWNTFTLRAIYNPLPTAVPPPAIPGGGQAPNIGGLTLGMVQGAVYDAVNMIDGGHEPYLDGLPSAPADASKAAAVATAAYHVLDGLGIAPVPALPAATRAWLKTEYDLYIQWPSGCRKAGRDRRRGCCGGEDAQRAHGRRPFLDRPRPCAARIPASGGRRLPIRRRRRGSSRSRA